MNLFDLITKYFWSLAILITCINFFMFRKRAHMHIKGNPGLQNGYRVILKSYLLWMNIPWIVMGLGCTVGGVPSVLHYLRPRDGNPYVLAWFATVILLWAAGTYWLFFSNGAETLARHPGAVELRYGLKRKDITNPLMIKALWLLCLAGGITGMVAIWSLDIPLQI